MTELEQILYDHSPDFVTVTETWLHDDIADSEIVPPGYSIIRKDRPSRGGGVAIIVKDGFTFSFLENVPGVESAWINVKLRDAPLVIGVAYRPPNSNISCIEALADFVSAVKRKHSFFILAGDFNLPHIDWRFSTSSTACPISELLLDMTFNNNLTQTVTECTHPLASGGSVLDLIFISEGISRSSYECVVDTGISDHSIASLVFSGPGCRPTSSGERCLSRCIIFLEQLMNQ